MKLPWDRNYFKISFYAVFTAIAIYLSIILINSAVYVITDFNIVADVFAKGVKSVLGLFSPVILAFVLAYLFEPMVEFYQRRYEMLEKRKKAGEKHYFKKRTAGAALSYITLAAALLAAAFSIYVRAKKSQSGMADELINTVNYVTSQVNEMLNLIYNWFAKRNMGKYFEDNLYKLSGYAKNSMSGFSNSLPRKMAAAGSFLFTLFLSLIVGFFIMVHKSYILYITSDVMDVFLPKKTVTKLKKLTMDFHLVFSSYIRGQLISASILALLTGAVLKILKVDFAILIGVITGIANLVPYLGGLVAFFLAVIMALISGPPVKALYVTVAITALQQIDGLIVIPKVVGRKVKLSPPLVILAMSIFGKLFGILGMVFALPSCAIAKIYITRYIEKRKIDKETSQRI